MALVKLEIDGKRVIADGGQTILEVARQHGICDIPTLCNDAQLEPFASCFVCVVKVKGARSLVPACSTRVTNGMVVESSTPEVRRSRQAALELLLSNHYADCVGPCQFACPAGVDIQGYVALAAIGKHHDAVKLIKERNPLPSVCGRVCTRPCEVKGCRRNLLDSAVGIDWIKRYVTDLDYGSGDAYRPPVAPANGRRVAVVGAGPAGLSCAYYLATRGYAVDMFEALPEAGGMLRYGIPEYRLPKDALDVEIDQVLSLGVTLKTNVALGRDFTVRSLKEDGYGAIFLGLGAWSASEMRVKGEDAPGVLSGIEFLKNFGLRRKADLHGRVLVVGGGNTAVDCARTALRCGVDEVRIVYRRTRAEMPANATEIHDAEQEGVRFDFLVAPTRVVTANDRVTGLECLRMELGDPDASGRRSPKPVKGSEFVMPCDFILSAIGQATRVTELLDGRVRDFLPMGETLNLTRWQTIRTAERSGETSVEGVFSGGDVVTGAATAIEAIAAGRKAAYAIDKYLATGSARPEPVEFFSRKDTFAEVTVADLRSREPSKRTSMPMLPVEERVKGFAEVETGLGADAARAEARRCQECGCQALFSCDLRRYATEYGVDITRFVGEAKRHEIDRRHPLIELDQNKCINCGRCVRMCSEVVGVAAYGYINRGFETVVKPALGGSLLDTECVSCGLCAATCPTGAIGQRIPLEKPGPWRTVATGTVCHYCGVGCRLTYETFGDTLVKVGRVEDEGVGSGNHCRKGRFGYGHVHAHDRLVRAKVRSGRELQDGTVEDALDYTAMRLKELSRRCSGDQFAVFVSPRLTNEEAYLAQKLARVVLKTHNVDSIATLVNPSLFCPDVVSTASYRDVVDAQVTVVADSVLDSEHFAADLLVKKSLRKGGKLVYVHPEDNRVARFADVFLKCAPGTQPIVLMGLMREACAAAGTELPEAARAAIAPLTPERVAELTRVDADALREAGAAIAKSILKALVCNRDFRGPRMPHDSRLFAAIADGIGASLLALCEKANSQGLLDMGCHPSWFPGYRSVTDEAFLDELEKEWCAGLRDIPAGVPDLAAAIRARRIKVVVAIGEDPFGSPGFPDDLKEHLLAINFGVVCDLFETETTRTASVVLPLSSTAETSGTYTNSERRVQSLGRAVPPASGYETWQVLTGLAARLGYRFKMRYDRPADVLAEIRRVVPAYRNVVLDARDETGCWDLSAFPLARVAPDWAAAAAGVTTTPVRTIANDHIEARFAAWFDGLMAAARAP
ncbi:MAG: FAD-dependent oxidoreductase [Deltaproteobacteria bacterium]|nr:FAD-dependent oxidoreductase [Deltaproteobacteria bacterium]